MGEENTKSSIIIDGKVHKGFKDYCRGKGLKIGLLTEDLIKLYLSDSKNLQKQIDEFKESSVTV